MGQVMGWVILAVMAVVLLATGTFVPVMTGVLIVRGVIWLLFEQKTV